VILSCNIMPNIQLFLNISKSPLQHKAASASEQETALRIS
jgi:hypothetical protein